ncbi:NAC domain-containing protein 96 [Ricinus communis]|uniref:NAC domain-containing protein n=1 Tax=Ricinus communis TaxID=3988 RepID=B9RMX7_RICCO|nr:NAC domain-containing protein 96 [Ricinus communis]EEF47100.1 hypothetical protein RCOM_1341380 [Ricinus communis]|eukprot:XP_002515116.1 NAC domain-containing protein 96 [Ricinus communis]
MNHNFPSAMTSPAPPDQSIPLVGYRFHPTDDELVDHFLKLKMLGRDNVKPPIPQIKVCDFEPWDIPALVNTNFEDQVWYFFCARDYKYLHSRRSNRTTKAGYWKPTGKPRKVKAKRTKEEIGTKRSLVFYIKDHPKPRRTKWIMHEYECIPNSTLATQGNFLLYKLKSRPDANINQGEPSQTTLASDLENQALNEMVVNFSSDVYEQGIPSAVDLDCNNLSKTMSTYEKGERNRLVEVTTDSAGDEVESRYCLGYELEAQNPNEATPASSCKTMDFDLQNPDQKTDISEASEEGEWSPALTPSGKSDMSASSIAADLENNAAKGTIFEVDPLETFYNGLEAFLELEEDFNAALLPRTSTNESLSYTRFDMPLFLQGY